MKNNKLILIMLILLVSISLVGTIAVIASKQFNGSSGSKEPSIDKILASSVDVPQITTNLANGDYIRMSFKIQTDSKKAKKELEKRDFQVKDIIIQELSEMESNELKGKAGQEKLKEELKIKLNKIMQNGKIEQVYITENLLQ